MLIIARNMFVSLLFLFIFSLPSYAQQSTNSMPLYKYAEPEETLKKYSVLPYKFIDLIKSVPKPLPVPLNKFQIMFNNQLNVVKDNSNYIRYASGVRYEAGPFRTLDGVVIKKVGISTELKKK